MLITLSFDRQRKAIFNVIIYFIEKVAKISFKVDFWWLTVCFCRGVIVHTLDEEFMFLRLDGRKPQCSFASQ